MSPRDAAAVDHIAADLRDLSDSDLDRLAAKNACLPGENAAAVRHAIDAEQEYRRAYRRSFAEANADLTAVIATPTRSTATTGGAK